ncbi:exonuclease domain-containing protein [Vibrio barjaei]|uniref:exonuclease domain-containing protein n=1 Tax=Vibrio barjaei TaxID=1676683 RepID=UPI002283BE52|nr:exonuclease domain-containing protein [Vibrio barjaei]MCY9869994.1 exonuclease domain-containing protein [Vibrio barjaei]
MLAKTLQKLFSKGDNIEALHQSMQAKHWPSHALEHYFAHPLPNAERPVSEQQFVALDFETTGLEPDSDRILSIGTVELNYEEINLTSVSEVILRQDVTIRPESAVVHEIMPTQVREQGIEAELALDRLIEHLRGKTIIAHSAGIEYGFLSSYLKRRYQIEKLPCYMIDTLSLEKRFSYLGKNRGHSSFQLDDLRQHYNLPDYYAHSAASDALGCAELFLAQVKRLRLCHRPLSEVIYRP